MHYFKFACQVSVIVFALASVPLVFAQEGILLATDKVTAEEFAVSCICNGLKELFNDCPEKALPLFEKASYARRDDQQIDETDFLIEFCTVIARDQLGNKQEAFRSQAFLSMFMDEKIPYHPSCNEVLSRKEALEAIGFLQNLSLLAPSSDIQEGLQSIVAQIDRAAAQDSLFGPNGEKQQGGRSSKFVKRWKHIAKRTRQIMEICREFAIIFKEILQ